MTIEKSHGKARPTLPRSSDLTVVETDRDPSEGRGVAGRFAPGNRIASGQRWKASIKRLLGKESKNSESEALVRETWRLYLALLRDMPSDGPTVRSLVALQARETALAAHWASRAAELGFASPEGVQADDRAIQHGQRAERLAVTAIDIATKLRASKRGRSPRAPWLREVKP